MTYRGGWLLALLGVLAAGIASADDAAPVASSVPAAPGVAGGLGAPAAPGVPGGALPHIRVDREKKQVSFDAKVLRREADWLELLVCIPGLRDHETLLTTPAKPSHIHLALLMLGLQPGAPLRGQMVEGQLHVDPPHGPALRVRVSYQRDGQTIVEPAGKWVRNQLSNTTLENATWLFAGSGFAPLKDQQVYKADLNGSIITLVSFGDDLLAQPGTLTNQNDESRWQAVTDAIPPVDTPVTVILEPIPPAAPGAEKKHE